MKEDLNYNQKILKNDLGSKSDTKNTVNIFSLGGILPKKNLNSKCCSIGCEDTVLEKSLHIGMG